MVSNPQKEDILNPETWVEEHGDILYAFALKKLRNPAVAEDLVQETLLAAWRSRSKFRADSRLRTWLIGILKHKIVDHIRKDSREAYLEDHPHAEGGSDLAFDRKGHWRTRPADWQIDPICSLERSELREAIEHAVDQLSPRLREVFIRRDLEGHSADHICEELQMSQTNFWVTLHRARQKLQQLLTPVVG